MSFLGLGAAAQGRSRSRSRSRTRPKDEDDNQEQYQMSGALPDGANYTTINPSTNNRKNTPSGGIPGVQYAKPLVATFATNTGGFGTAPAQADYAASAGGYQYATAPAGVRYTSKPVIHPSYIAPIEAYGESKEEKKKKKKKEVASYEEVEDIEPHYATMTIEPGGKSSKKKKKNEPEMKLPFGGMYGGQMPPPPPPMGMPSSRSPFGGMPPPPPPPPRPFGVAQPEYYPVATPGSYPVATPSGYPVGAPSEYSIGAPDGRPILAPSHSYGEGVQIKDVAPRGASPTKSKSKSKSHRLSTSGMRPDLRAPSPSGIRGRSDRLSVSGGSKPIIGGNLPPPSPMLEAYRGTWQSMPGMPSPMMRGRDDLDDYDIEELEPLEPRESRESRQKVKVKSSKGNSLTIQKVNGRSSSRQRSVSRARSRSPKKKTVSMYESEQDAKLISGELVRAKPDFRVLTDVLPGLTHDQIIELHTAYKNVAKYQGKGINIAKHIKLKVPGQLRTIAYVTALGRWESEGYWANYWYQSAVSKRELLIESLMGRTNFEMQMIKENFRDKRYSDSLVRCMDKELRVDKFRTAAMQALEANRQEENEIFPPEYIEKDVDTWIRALKGKSGGETAMLEICVTRSDAHLKKCLRTYEREVGGNFAKQALARSENLVGEVMAHILNGVINRPARDAMLLHHALLDLKPRSKDRRGSSGSSEGRRSPKSSATKILPGLPNPFAPESREAREREKQKKKEKEKEREDRKDRYELLISRVVRLHWDKIHLRKVKDEYRDKFDAYVEDDAEDWLKEGEFREFVLELLHTN